MTSFPVIFKKIESNNTSTDECANGNNDDFAISPVEGYSEVKMIPSPYSKKAHVDSSGESTPTASNDGSSENLMIMSISKTSQSSPTKLLKNLLLPLSGSEIETKNLSVENKINQIELNNIPQWKKDLILRKKNNIARTIEGNQENQPDTTITRSYNIISKTVNPEKPSTFLKKISPISPTISTKSITSSSGELSSSSKIEIKSPVAVSSSSIQSSNSIKNSNQFKSPFNNKNNKIISNATSIKNDVANDDLNKHYKNLSSSSFDTETNQSPVKILSKGNNIITKNQNQKINKIDSTSSSTNNELILTSKKNLITTTTIDNNNFSKNHQMPVKILNSNVKSVANKYTENLNLNNSIQQTTLSSLPSSPSSSTSVVKTIIGKITSKGQYTKSNSNNMIDSSSTTLIKSEKLNLNTTNTTLTTPKTTLLQQSELNKGILNRIGILPISQQQHQNNSNKNFLSNDSTTTIQKNPPIPKRRTSLNKQFQQQQTEHMATSLSIIQKGSNNNTIKKPALEIELQLEEQKQQQKHMEVKQHFIIPSKEIEEKEEKDKIHKQQLQQQQQSNLLLTNQLHSRYESVKIGVNTCADVNQIASKQKNSLNIELKASVSSSFNTDDNLTKVKTIVAINSNDSIVKKFNKNNNGDGSDVDENDGVGNNIIFDDDASASPVLKLENLIDNPNLKNINNLISDNEIVINNDTFSKKNIISGTPTTTIKTIKNSQLISQSQTNLSNKNQHQGGYIKNPTVNKNSTATINKYIAAANATASGIKKNQIPNSPKNLILLNNNNNNNNNNNSNNSVLSTTTPTSSLPSSTASTLLLLSNNKNKPEFNSNSNNFIKNKMVAVQEIQLKSSSSSIATTPQQQIATTNGESSSTVNGGDSSSSVTTTINNLKTTITATNYNNNKRTKMINNVKNNKIYNKDMNINNDNENDNDEFNDFDPSEELQYGPGIVSKLRCRYLSLALRQSTGKPRLPLDNLRRATSLNNLLDGSSNSVGVGPTIVGKNKILNGGACGNSNGAYNSVTNSTTNGTTIKSNYIKNHNGKTILSQMIIDEDNDYEDLIISSNHNHSINNKNHQQNGFNSSTSISSSSKEFQEEKERENTCSLYTASAAIITMDNDDINLSSSLSSSAATNEFVEKPDYQQQQEQQNSFTCNNKKLTSAVAASSGHIGKNNSVSSIIAEKNKTITNQYIRNTTATGNTTTTSSAAAAAAAAGIIRSGRQIKRGNDSIKRARSVEALLCEKPDIWTVNNSSGDDTLDNDINNCCNTNNSNINIDVDQLSKQKENSNNIMSVSAHAALHWNNTTNINTNNLLSPTNNNESPILNEVTIEHKITNAREQRKLDKHPPKRLTSVIDDTERPPPDVVKQTLKIFEAGANRRGGRGLSKNHHSGHVAMKVANYKSIISQDQPNNQKPPISYPKPPLSPKRLNSLNGSVSNNTSTNVNGGQNIKNKPNTLNIQNGNSNNNNKKFNKSSPKSGSPVSSLTKRFNSQSSTEDSIEQQNMSNNSSKSTTPTLQFTNNCGITSPTTIGHLSYSLKNRSESTPVGRTTTPTTQQKTRAPDVIPRKIFDSDIGISPVVNTAAKTTNGAIGGGGGGGETFDSPITQLTKRIDRLKLETPPPPPSSSSTSSGVSSQTSETSTTTTTVIQNYESSVKSSDSESSDREDDFNSYDVTLPHDDDYDYDDDDNDSIDGDDKVVEKKISKTALENISKAGSSQCFSFKNVKTTPLIGIKSSSLGSNVEPISLTTVPTPAPKQVGIIRPLVAEPKLLSNVNDDDNSVVLKSYNQTQDNSIAPPQPLKRNSLLTDTDNTVVIGTRTDNSSASNENNLVITNLSQNQPTKSNDKLLGAATSSCNTATNSELNSSIEQRINKPALTSREIEKNLINEKKNELANLENYVGNTTAASTTTSNSISSSSSSNNANNNNSNELQNWQQQLSQKKKNSSNYGNSAGGPIEASNNIMVFNFKDRKEVPDYIENDGLFIKRKRELPKPNESGFVLLGDLSLETSTDPDDSWTMGPPSPCNVEFENANIIIDGKSSLRFRSKDGSLRVQFDDTLTSTFEYPSESSLLDDYVMTPTDNFYVQSSSNPIDTIDNNQLNHHVQVEEIIPVVTPIQSSTPTPTTKSLGNIPIGSVPLGNYTPVKVQLQRHFELGVTRVPNAVDGQSVNDFLLNEQQHQQQQNGHSNKNNSSINSSTKSSTSEYNNKKSTNGIFSDNIIKNDDDDDNKLLQEEPDSLQYLKPATDDLTVVYSEGTQKADLLY